MSLAKRDTDKCRVYQMPQLLCYHARLVMNSLVSFAAFFFPFFPLKRSNRVCPLERERENGTKSVLESVATELISSQTSIKFFHFSYLRN